MSWERSRWDADWVTCGAECDERQGVLADHRQLIFGQGQPVYDVLYEVVGDDRGHVPPQLSQDDQFPVLQRQRSKKKKKKRCWAQSLLSLCSQDHSSFWWLSVRATQGYAERTIPFNGCAAMAPLTVKQNQCDPVPRKWLCKES